jgi:hypothetical protein
MNREHAARQTTVSHQRLDEAHTRLHGHWLRLLQALWSLLVICDLFVLMLSLPAFYQVLHTVCSGPIATCFITDQLLPQELIALHQAGISLHAYALAVFCLDLVASLAFLLVGALIIWRRANTWMGLFVSFLLINFGSLGLSTSHESSLSISPTNSLDALASGIGLPLSMLAYLCFACFFFTFPNARFVPRWSWVLLSLWMVNFVVFTAPPDSPLNINNWSGLLAACWLLTVFGGSLSTQIYRFRRVASLRERQQIKWLIYGFAPVLLLPICFALFQLVFPSLFWQAVTEPLYRFYYLPVPLCIGIAILRYRLWDIDLLIKRTLLYGTLSVSLGLIYVSLILGLQFLLQGVLGQGNALVIVASTLAIAALFSPLRRGIQNIVDRRFYRSKYDAAKTVATFSTALRNEVDLRELSEHLITVVQETMQPSHVSLWLRPPEHDGTHRAPWRAIPPVSSDGK